MIFFQNKVFFVCVCFVQPVLEILFLVGIQLNCQECPDQPAGFISPHELRARALSEAHRNLRRYLTTLRTVFRYRSGSDWTLGLDRALFSSLTVSSPPRYGMVPADRWELTTLSRSRCLCSQAVPKNVKSPKPDLNYLISNKYTTKVFWGILNLTQNCEFIQNLLTLLECLHPQHFRNSSSPFLFSATV